MFSFQKGIQTLSAKFATPAALFYPPERRLACSGETIVDPDYSGIDRFGEAKHAAQITREGVSAETVRRTVRALDCFDLGIERANGGDGGKGFFEHAQGAFGNVG